MSNEFYLCIALAVSGIFIFRFTYLFGTLVTGFQFVSFLSTPALVVTGYFLIVSIGAVKGILMLIAAFILTPSWPNFMRPRSVLFLIGSVISFFTTINYL